MAAKRLDAVKLAKSSRWDELRRLVDAEPATAQQVDSYGMLPLHWACTEPHSVGEGVLLALLKAFPHGARAANTAEMLPLQIAIKAQAKIEWLQALLASHPDAVLKKAPSGENAVQLARKAGLSSRSIKLLEEMYHHVCIKEGYPDQLALEEAEQTQQQTQIDEEEGQLRPSERFQAIAGDLPVPRVSGSHYGRQRRLSSTASLKLRSFSDNDFYAQQMGTPLAPTLSISSSADTMRSTGVQSARPQFSNARGPARPAVSLPPRWMNAPSCSICALKFGTFKKRHHCRNCGQSICRDHSARERMKLPHYGLSDRHRVCVECHDILRNANRQARQQQITMQAAQRALPQPRIGQAMGDARRSDEAQRSPPPAAPQMLERHVSAPARATNSSAGPYGRAGSDAMVSEQVATLQKQVSQLMEEKQLAEMQLRVQAEMLSDPERLTAISRSSAVSGGSGVGPGSISSATPRDRQNSYPLKLRTGSSASADGVPGPIPNAGAAMYRSTGQLLNRTHSTGSFRAREIDIDSPSFGDVEQQQQQQQQQPRAGSGLAPGAGSTGNPALQRTTRLQDALNNIAVVESTYDAEGSESDSDLENRRSDVADLHDADADAEEVVDAVAQEYLVDEDDDEDDDDEEAVVEAAKAAKTNEEDEAESEDDVGGDTLPEVDVLVNLGHLMMDKGSVSAAVQAFTRAVEIRPEDPALHSLLGRAYYADENLDDAVAAITRSLELE
ncbi:hypothetical protein BBJ28_00025680, partial [Nothophytophthora sp. Chile5]